MTSHPHLIKILLLNYSCKIKGNKMEDNICPKETTKKRQNKELYPNMQQECETELL